MSGIASVGSSKFITRILAATVSLLALYPLSTMGLTGAFALVGISGAAAEPVGLHHRNRGAAIGRGPTSGGPRGAPGIGGLSIGLGGGLGVGLSQGSRSSHGGSPGTGVSGGDTRGKSTRKVSPPVSNRTTSNTAGTVKRGYSRQGSSKASSDATWKRSPAGASGGIEQVRDSGSSGGFNTSPGLIGSTGSDTANVRKGPINQGGATRDGGGKRESEGSKRDLPGRAEGTPSQENKAADRDGTTSSRDNAAPSHDGAVASRDSAGGFKAEDIRRAIDRCAQTYVSYDRATMTYTDHLGDKQSCP